MADTNKKAAPSPEELLLQKDTELAALKEQLQAQTEAIQAKEELYSASQEELEALRNQVNELRSAAKDATAKPAKPVPGVKFEFEGLKYKFKDNAPKSIRIDGVVKSQKELAADEETLLQLVASNSGLIEKIYE